MHRKSEFAELESSMLNDTVWLRAEFFRIVPALTAREVAALAAIPGSDGHSQVEQWRAEGRLFSVRRDVDALYPAFQFKADLHPLPIIREVLEILRRVRSRSDWDNALWFIGPNGWLSGSLSFEQLESKPDLVKHAAEQEVLPDTE
jgi:hypothetical protein